MVNLFLSQNDRKYKTTCPIRREMQRPSTLHSEGAFISASILYLCAFPSMRLDFRLRENDGLNLRLQRHHRLYYLVLARFVHVVCLLHIVEFH